MIPDSLPQPTPTLSREDKIAGQHEALDMFVCLRRHYPAFTAEQARNRAKMPRCVNHPDKAMATYQDGVALCADCYVAWIETQREA